MRRLLNALLYLPARETGPAPEGFFNVQIGGGLHGWWVPARAAPTIGHVLVCHGNGGNIGDRIPHAVRLSEAGFDVLLFDYRGYGRSPGRPSERGTYADARAAREALLVQDDVDAGRVLYLGESLGAAVALELAIEHPPAGLILQSPFTSVRDIARVHYPLVPRALVPDAYPSLRLVAHLRAPLLVLHGARDEIVPLLYGEALFDAAPEPKRLEVFPDAAHNDLIARFGDRWVQVITEWASGL